MEKLYSKLEKALKTDPRFVDQEGELFKNEVIDKAYKADQGLIEILISDKELEQKFFSKIKTHSVFNINEFVSYIQDKNFLNDSYTKFKNKIGLNIDGKFLNERKEVSLVWPFKDCVLEGGMSKEDEKKKEIFFNEILAADDIDKLFAPKVLTNWKRYTKNGEEKVGELKRDSDGTIRENLIIKGNNLLALHTLKTQFQGKVKLIYIDPPFNTEKDTFRYNDNFSHSAWLTFFKNRLEISKDLLAQDGSIYVHLDYHEVHYAKIILDDVFGRDNFNNEIIWHYQAGTAPDNAFAKKHDNILVYVKNKNSNIFNTIRLLVKDESIYPLIDKDGRKYRLSGNKNETAYYADEGRKADDVWTWLDRKENNIGQVFHAHPENLDFGGQKPEKLLERIIRSSTNEGDIVLDFFAGTGTTASVSHKINRQWIIIEQLDSQVEILLSRLSGVVIGDNAGISKEINWKGGGGFVYFELMKYNETFVNEIEKAKDIKALLSIWKEMKEKAFFKYSIDLQEFDKSIEEFKKLDLKKQKDVLMSLLNKNQMYVNLSEIEDKSFGVGKGDKEMNKKFYV